MTEHTVTLHENGAAMSAKLTKSIRTYRRMVESLPWPLQQRTAAYQDALAYLRALDAEFGREKVRLAYQMEVNRERAQSVDL